MYRTRDGTPTYHPGMRTLVALLPLLALLVACGGGGGAGDPAGEVLGIAGPDVLPPSADYRAVFACSAQAQASTAPIGLTLTGRLTIENAGTTVVYPLEPARSALEMRNTLVLDVPALVRTQVPQLPEQVTVLATDYVEVAADGAWYSLGGATTDTRPGFGETYRTWASSPILVRRPQLLPGQVIDNAAVEMLAEDLVTVLATRRLVRSVSDETVVLTTPLGRLECYVVEEVETLQGTAPDAEPQVVAYRRWERPDFGVLRLELDLFSVTIEGDTGPVTVTLRNVECALESLVR